MEPHLDWVVIIPSSLLGIAGSLAGWLNDIMQGRRKLALLDFFTVVFIGGFLGVMGDQLAAGMGQPLLRGVLAGALAVSGLRGFDFLSRKLMGLGP
jgi:hypothetical protein